MLRISFVDVMLNENGFVERFTYRERVREGAGVALTTSGIRTKTNVPKMQSKIAFLA